MTVDTSMLSRSKSDLRFIHDRRNRINLVREILASLLGRHLEDGLLNLHGEEADRKRTESQLFLELSIYLSNSLSDALLRVANNELLADDRIAESRIRYDTLVKRLSSRPIANVLREIRHHPSVVYITAAANTLKHRSLVDLSFRLDSTGFYGPVLASFEHDSQQFASKDWSEVFVEIDALYSKIIMGLSAVVKAIT